MTGDRIRVLVVDDASLVRRGVVEVLSERDNIEVVGEAGDGAEAIELTRALDPDLVVMDLQMPRVSGLEATSAIYTEMPHVNILIFTVSENESDLFAAMHCGARGYVLKNATSDDLWMAVTHTAQGGVIVSPTMASKMLGDISRAPGTTGTNGVRPPMPDELSAREMEVLEMLASGASNPEIAQGLFISENTVKTHLRRILDKLHLANRRQAAVYAARLGLGRPGQGAGG